MITVGLFYHYTHGDCYYSVHLLIPVNSYLEIVGGGKVTMIRRKRGKLPSVKFNGRSG